MDVFQFESIGGVPVDVFQGLPSNSVLLCLTSWENQKKSAKTSEKMFVDLQKSGSSLGAISKHLKVPRSSVQTIVRVQINPSTTAKDLVKMLEETGTKVSISTVKRVLYRHNLKGRSAGKKPLLQNCHIKTGSPLHFKNV